MASKPKNKPPQHLLKCPMEAINEPSLLAAIEDYNNLSNVPLIIDFTKPAAGVAADFAAKVSALTDAQCDGLKDTTIEFFNFLLTPSELPADFLPGPVLFPMGGDPEEVIDVPPVEAPAMEDVMTNPPKAEKAPRAPRVSGDERFTAPKATTVIMACVVEGIREPAKINAVLEKWGLSASPSTLSVMLGDVQRTLDYQEFLKKGGQSICNQ